MSLKSLLFAIVLVAPSAHADESEGACFTAAVEGQKARKAGKLHEAREAFARCAQAACPAEVTDHCTSWIAEVDDAMPSVLVATRDASGHDLATGVVRIDAQEQSVLAGKPIPLEPGPHELVLEVPGKPRVVETIVLREHEKNRAVVLELPAPPAPVIVRRPSIAPFVLGGIGLAFAAAFGGFATAGYLDRQSSGCDVPTGCSPGDYTRVRVELVTADVSLGLAGAFLVAAVIDFVLTRSAAKKTAFATPFSVAF
jgi:hypothetical protein